MSEETGTPETEAVEESWEDQMVTVVNRQSALIDQMAETLEVERERAAQLEARLNELENPGSTEEAYDPPPLPEGMKRYYHTQFSEHMAIKVPGDHIVVEGRRIYQKAIAAEFTGGVYETTDPEMQEWIENGDDFKHGVIVLAPDAVRRHSTVVVQDGPRHTESTPRAGLAAQMN